MSDALTQLSANPLRSLAHQLVEDGLLEATRALALEEQAHREKRPLLKLIIEETGVSQRDAIQSAGWAFGLGCVDLDAIPVARLPPLQGLPESMIRRLGVLPLLRQERCLIVAVDDPSRLPVLDELQFVIGMNVEGVLAPADQLSSRLEQYLEVHGEGALALLEGQHAIETLALEEGDIEEQVEDASFQSSDDAPVVRFVKQILLDGIRRGASDIHFEPFEESFRIRFRIDGMLMEASRPPAQLRQRIAARIKVMAKLDISERRLPQDGSVRLKLSTKRHVEFRVNTLPTLFGEKIVMRLLDPNSARMGIDALGFTQEQRGIFEQAIARPQGMILVTGPTGSGKTVTLYTALNLLNTEARNIATAEDPVEIKLEGINQVNVRPGIGFDFAAALRAFLRQDPDVVMVGEIRDLETAEVAIKAAQTGHLVLSTLHTNSAAETLTRLGNMGVAGFNIATSISLIIAQRLARRLCEHCRQPVALPHEVLKHQGLDDEEIERATLYQAVGCEHCTHGYRGRVGIYEMVPISAAMSHLIMQDAGAMALAGQAKREGHHDLRRNGLYKVLAGLTTLEELNRIIQE
ncbi:type 4 fimbrial assembly protein PilB [Kushneria pakistanensis]|uniref:Type 4 fimbrial assembly protein PilB n=1 Tax=Kushneria pakistanensis TaxID=1508770 RepID=A0ABQ3FQH2_9GAMM|nr:type IV-A pilus assembly ATPase PilB [Kushneria pakistanensis]GHC32540.1 type 4 fimbrial assembly protein PilB [Kushneria pakistanensis]